VLEEKRLLEVAGVVGPVDVTEIVPGCTVDVNEVAVVVSFPPPEPLPPPPLL
jgi:hypothetical protein